MLRSPRSGRSQQLHPWLNKPGAAPRSAEPMALVFPRQAWVAGERKRFRHSAPPLCVTRRGRPVKSDRDRGCDRGSCEPTTGRSTFECARSCRPGKSRRQPFDEVLRRPGSCLERSGDHRAMGLNGRAPGYAPIVILDRSALGLDSRPAFGHHHMVSREIGFDNE